MKSINFAPILIDFPEKVKLFESLIKKEPIKVIGLLYRYLLQNTDLFFLF